MHARSHSPKPNDVQLVRILPVFDPFLMLWGVDLYHKSAFKLQKHSDRIIRYVDCLGGAGRDLGERLICTCGRKRRCFGAKYPFWCNVERLARQR